MFFYNLFSNKIRSSYEFQAFSQKMVYDEVLKKLPENYIRHFPAKFTPEMYSCAESFHFIGTTDTILMQVKKWGRHSSLLFSMK